MNRKVNTALFVLAASVVNVFIMLFFMTLLLSLAGLFLPADLSPGLGQVIFFLVFAASIGGSFFIYHRFIGFLSRKIDMDAYFHPLFKRRDRKP